MYAFFPNSNNLLNLFILSLLLTMQKGDTRRAILNLLKRRDSSVSELSSQLGLSQTATRQHLFILERDGLITETSVKGDLGRPKILYSLTEKAEELFPKLYPELTKWIISDMIGREGAESVRALMGRLGTKQASFYKNRVRGDRDVESVVNILNELGAFAEVEQAGDKTLLKVCNCPLHAIVLVFGDIICEFGLQFIGTLLNTPVKLTSCMTNGDRDCFYVEA
jgi:predicted ArsR family transcriptional regulator